MTANTTASEPDRHDDSVRDNRNVAWHARGDGELFDPLDTPVYVGEVYELVSVILKHAPYVSRLLPEECVIEVTNHRAWPELLEICRAIDENATLHEGARSC